MKRRTTSALPAFYSQVRRASTATKAHPQPAWDNSDLTVRPPAPNLSKWAASPSRAPDSIPPRKEWSRPPNSSKWNSSGKSARPDFTRTPSREPTYNSRGGSSTGVSNSAGRWERQEPSQRQAPSSQRSSFGLDRNPRSQRDGLPHSQRDGLSHQQRDRFFDLQSNRSHRVNPSLDIRDKSKDGKAQGGYVRDTRTRDGQNSRIGSSRAHSLQDRQEPHDVSRTSVGNIPGVDVEAEDIHPEPSVRDEELEVEMKRPARAGKDKANFKTRGSILSQLAGGQVAIPSSSRVSDPIKTAKEKKKKDKAVKKINADVFIPSTVSVGQLARLLNVRMPRLQKKMVAAGMEEESAYDYVLTSEYAGLLAEEFGRNPIINDEAAFDIYPRPPHPNPSSLPSRPPIVTIMGHVDHGKTTLLDTLRSASVAKGEAGGITQHIGAFSVPVPGASESDGPRTITFLDTPGHAAFSAMRARGAGVTDIIVLVVAADDGVMPQTKEVIELTKKDEGKVGVVVAINKVDKHGVNVENVTQALMAEGIQLESYGGDTPGVEVSGLTGHGLDNLVETLSAMAEIQDLRAERDGQVHGYVLESRVHKGLGPVATVLIVRGCLTISSHLLAGTCHAKVRLMNDSAGKAVKQAYPGMAVTVSGWKELPNAGDEVLSGPEGDVKKALANRIRKAEIEVSLADMEAINAQRISDRRKETEEGEEVEASEAISGPKELRLIIKGDVSGSVEALEGALQGIGNSDAVAKIVSTGVGDVTESDVNMAKTAGGMIVAFSVNIPRAVERVASSNTVPIYESTIIYRVMEEVRDRVAALLPPVIEKKVTGEANVLQIFDIQIKSRRTKPVAGCRVINGLVEKSRHGRVVRDGNVIHEGPLETLKHGKQDLTEVRKGMECGLSFVKFDDVQEGDLIQMFQTIEKPGVL